MSGPALGIRVHAVHRLKRKLEAESFPRLQMGLIVGLTGGFGLLASFTFLHVGVESMALRYPMALGMAYLFFLFLLWLWLRTNADDYGTDGGLGDFGVSPGSKPGSPQIHSGQGGDYGGGGASASFDTADGDLSDAATPTRGLGSALGSVGDADEFAVPLVAIALALGLALASLYVIYLAPALFAELLFDGVLSYSLYRHLRHTERQHWLSTAMHRTAIPFGITAIFLCAIGAAMMAYAPGSRSIGEVIKHVRHR